MKILELHLLTKDLMAQKNFYAQVLGLKILEESAEHVMLKIGQSKLIFRPNPKINSAYHIAFNIPENKISAAATWLSARCKLIANTTGQTHFEFSNWNADSIYFYDAAGNILELIARHDLNNATDTEFSGTSFLNISEIGLATPNVSALRDWLCQTVGLEPYKAERFAPSPSFCPLGDANGLFILVAQNREWYPDTGINAQVLPVEVVVQSEKTVEHTAPNLPYCFKLSP